MLNSFKSVITLPIWSIQALIVKRQAVRLPEATGIRVHQLENSLKLLVIGDSVAAGVGVDSIQDSLAGAVSHQLSEKSPREISWAVHAKSGDKLADLLHKLDSFDYCADHIVISIGVNDVTSFTSAKLWQKQMSELLHKLVARNSNTRIILIAIPPMEAFPLLPSPLSAVLGERCALFNAKSRGVIKQFRQVDFLDITIEVDSSMFASDGYHPSAKSCKMLAEEISDKLLKN